VSLVPSFRVGMSSRPPASRPRLGPRIIARGFQPLEFRPHSNTSLGPNGAGVHSQRIAPRPATPSRPVNSGSRFGSCCCFHIAYSLAPRVCGRSHSGASSPLASVAREASTLSLTTCHPGFARRGIDPVRTWWNPGNFPAPALARRLTSSTRSGRSVVGSGRRVGMKN
jgi:hypothetical protein